MYCIVCRRICMHGIRSCCALFCCDYERESAAIWDYERHIYNNSITYNSLWYFLNWFWIQFLKFKLSQVLALTYVLLVSINVHSLVLLYFTRGTSYQPAWWQHTVHCSQIDNIVIRMRVGFAWSRYSTVCFRHFFHEINPIYRLRVRKRRCKSECLRLWLQILIEVLRSRNISEKKTYSNNIIFTNISKLYKVIFSAASNWLREINHWNRHRFGDKKVQFYGVSNGHLFSISRYR